MILVNLTGSWVPREMAKGDPAASVGGFWMRFTFESGDGGKQTSLHREGASSGWLKAGIGQKAQ